MKIRPKSATKRVGILSNPEPNFVALVSHGANQEPFTTLKSETGEIDMPKSAKQAAKKAVVVKFQLSTSVFATEADVRKAMKAMSIEDDSYTLEKTDDVWVAKSTEDFSDKKLGKAASTATKTAGITAFVAEEIADNVSGEDAENSGTEDGDGSPEVVDANKAGGKDTKDKKKPDAGKSQPASAADTKKAASKVTGIDGNKVKKTTVTDADLDDGETDTVLKFPEAVKKYDAWAGYMSNSGDLLGVIKDGTEYDGVPPGVDAVMSAVYCTLGNILSGAEDGASKQKSIKQLGEDFADLSYGLYELFQHAEDQATKSANNDVRTAAKAFADGFRDSVTKAAQATKAKDKKMPVEPDEDDTKTTKADAVAPVVPSVEDIAKAVAKTLEPRLAHVEKTVQEQASRAPTKKSLSEAFTDDLEDPEAVKKAALVSAQRKADARSIMGFGR